METVGVYLKKKRESKNISLSEVSRLTKISEFYLDYIEKDDYEKLPQGPYIKGYISSYSRTIGSDVDEALNLYDSINRKKNQTETIPAGMEKDPGWKSSIGARFNAIVTPSDPMNGPEGHDNPPAAPGADAPKRPASRPHRHLAAPWRAVAPALTAVTAGFNGAGTRFKSWTLLVAKIPSGLKAVRIKPEWTAGALKSAVSQLSRADRAMQTVGRSISKAGGFFMPTVAVLRKAALAGVAHFRSIHRRGLLVAGLALCGALILVLAGFGFYHLFIYDGPSPGVTDSTIPLEKGASRPIATRTESRTSPAPFGETNGVREQSPSSAGKARATQPAAKPPNRSALEPADVEPSTASRSSLPAPAVVPEQAPARQAASLSSDPVPQTVEPSPPVTPKATANLSVIKASVCSNIQNRMPAGVDTTFPPSIGRVYVWNQIEARRFPSKISHIYYFKGNRIDEISLDVRSANWRTWSAKSIPSHGGQGEWRVDITSADGDLLRRLHFEIK